MRLLITLFFCATICEQPDVDASRSVEDLRRFDREAGEGARGYQWLRWSTDAIGHRLTGSPQGARAERAADSLFRISGLDHVERMPFSAEVWTRAHLQVHVTVGTEVREVRAVALANTPVAADVHAPLVDAGNGLEADLDAVGDALRGAMVLMNLRLVNAPAGARNLHRSMKVALARQRGAAGVVFVNQVEGGVLLTGTASLDGEQTDIPAVCIGLEDGAALRAALAEGRTPTAHITMRNHRGPVQAHNVVAQITGSRWPDEVIVVGGHLDSWDLATGAVDNGIGAFSVLDLARAMVAAGVRPERTVRFVLFMGEEQGLLGSRALVDHYRRTGELERVRCMINLDMSGSPQGFGVAGPEGWSDQLGTICAAMRMEDSTHFAGRTSEEVWLHSDHQPFLLAGVPVLYPLSDLGAAVYACYHSDCDDIQLVDPRAMVDNVRRVGRLVLELAATPALPPTFTPEQLRTRLQRAGLEQELRVSGEWPW